MNAAETLEIIRQLHAVGASHFKSGDFEITLNGSVGAVPVESKKQEPMQAPHTENHAATEKLKALINTLNMPPEQLVDQIFPNGAGG
jgi:hypothetical protein